MPLTSADAPLPRRNARSFDLDDSATKAAAWVWHLHESKPGVTTEGRFLNLQARRRNSSSSADRRSSRFRHEAVTDSIRSGASARGRADAPMWDCGSSLYDTFELVTFGNWLDRRMIGAAPTSCATGPAASPSPPPPRIVRLPSRERQEQPSHKQPRIPRARSLPNSLQPNSRKHTAAATVSVLGAEGVYGTDLKKASLSELDTQEPASPRKRGSVEKLVKAFKKVGFSPRQWSVSVGCTQSVDIVEPNRAINRPIERPSLYESMELEAKHRTEWASSRHEYTWEEDLKPHEMGEGVPKSGKTFLQDASLRKAKSSSVRVAAFSSQNAERLEYANKACQSPPQNYHKYMHYHHHHHHHHHHYLYHTLASQPARPSSELLSRIRANKSSWVEN